MLIDLDTELARLREENIRMRLDLDEMQNLARSVAHQVLRVLKSGWLPGTQQEWLIGALGHLDAILGADYINRRGQAVHIKSARGDRHVSG